MMTIGPVLPMFAAAGVPETRPVAASQVIQAGQFVKEYVSGSSLASSPTGAKV